MIVLEGTVLIGIGSVIAGVVSVLTWLVTRRSQGHDEGRGLIEDAIQLQKATHASYEEAQEELELMRKEMQVVRDDLADLQAEMTHYRTVAREAREEYRSQNDDADPFWWRPYTPSTSN